MSVDIEDTFIVVGSGPSLTRDQIEFIRQKGWDANVIAVNDNYTLVPWTDYLFAADLKWWRHHYDNAVVQCCTWTEFHTLRHIIPAFEKSNHQHPSYYLKGHDITREIDHLDVSTMQLYHGGCSGILAMELARIEGAKKIILVGFDMQHTGGKSHWFGDHPEGFLNANACERWVKEIASMMYYYEQLGIEVVNCSIETAIDSIKRSTLEEEL